MSENGHDPLPLHRYEVGIMSDVCTIDAPNAAVAAVYYGLMLVNTNNPFLAVVYTEDGATWDGDAYWLHLLPDEAHVKMVAERIGGAGALTHCRIVKEEKPNDST